MFPKTITVLVSLLLSVPIFGQKSDLPGGNLHAFISAQLPIADESLIQLDLVLRNDSDRMICTNSETWALVIDDQNADKYGTLFGNGITIGNGADPLEVGEIFGKGFGLSIRDYFPEHRTTVYSGKANSSGATLSSCAEAFLAARSPNLHQRQRHRNDVSRVQLHRAYIPTALAGSACWSTFMRSRSECGR